MGQVREYMVSPVVIYCQTPHPLQIILAARNMETLYGAKFERLRRFWSVKPTYSDREIHKLTNSDQKKIHRHFKAVILGFSITLTDNSSIFACALQINQSPYTNLRI